MNIVDILFPAAWAQDGAEVTARSSGFAEIFILIGFIAIFYLLILRPQSKRQRAHRELVQGLAKQDEVILGGGLLGKIIDINDDFLFVEVTEGTVLRFQRQAVVSVVPKGTIGDVDKARK